METGTGGAVSGDDESDFGALICLAIILAMHNIAVDPHQLAHNLGHFENISAQDLIRSAMSIDGVRAKLIPKSFEKLERLPLPALAFGSRGWFIIGRADSETALIQHPGSSPIKISREALAELWSGELILITTRESAGHGGKNFDFTWFLPQIVKYRHIFAEVLLLTMGLNLLGLAAPLFFQNVVDKVLVNQTFSTLQVLALGLVFVSAWEVVFGWLRTRLFSETSQKLDVELGAKLFRHLLSLPISYFENRRVGDTVTRVRQLEQIREFLTNASLTVLVDPLFAVVFLIAMWVYSKTLFWVVVATIPAYVAVSLMVTGPLRRRLDEKYERGAANNALLVESVSGIQTIKASAVEPQWQNRWERQLAGYSASNQRVIDLNNTGTQAIQLISKMGLAAILYFGAGEVIAGTMTVGSLIAFNMFSQRVSGPVIRMSQLWQDFQQVRLSLSRLGDVLNTPQEPGAGSRTALPSMVGHVRFDQVRFRYGTDGPWTIEGVSFQVPAGGTLGIVGSSGSGKSTLTKLLQRLYTPASGRIYLDGVDISQIDPAWLRRQVGVVLQENLLFNRSVRDNIALANPAMPLDKVISAAELAGAHEFILGLPQGYDTLIEERGSNLSGGQRQRLAIARALVTEPRLLIFDEATSALDAESEEIIQRNLKAMARGRTVLIIAHRLSAIRQCDRILTLEQGRIVEFGSHEQLLSSNGRYADLHRRQAGPLQDAAA
ncbi:type I secretion system permease/ATPase [Sphingomonas sp. HF-S3]|uniref:Type I secretion system permease/ATPase n=1 Tax=Sphingomonas rustica TaxID=3103142 RepID=A0ABV0B7S1_9SPHN